MRAPTTIVMSASVGRVGAHAHLPETLRPTLGLRDHVVVVDDGCLDGTSEGLRRFPWVRVVRHEEDFASAADCDFGAAVATGDVAVFLDDDTLLPSRWLDGLLRPSADPTVGPPDRRCDVMSGPQLVPAVPCSANRRRAALRAYRAGRTGARRRTPSG